MPKILHVITDTGWGGAERHLLALTTGFVQRGHVCQVAYLVGDGYLDDTFASRGVPTTNLRARSWVDPGALARLIRLIRRERFDLLHVHLFPGEVFATVAGLCAPGAPLICSKHNDEAFLRKWHFRMLHRVISYRASRTIAISDHVRRFTMETGTAHPSRVLTIRYGYEPPAVLPTREASRATLGAPAGAFLVGAAGRLAEQKGHRHLIEAIPALVPEIPNLQVVIVGEGPMRPALERRARELGVDRHVRLPGFHPDVQSLLCGLDVFVMPSLWEGFGLVLLEAMAAGRPIVAAKVSAIPEVIEDGETGLLVPPADASALGGAILRLWHDPSLREKLGNAGRERLRERFSLDQMVDETERVYAEVLANRPSR